MDKTNVMRILDVVKQEYTAKEYDSNLTDGCSVAKAVNEDENIVFKTLVTVGSDLNHYVFVIPVNSTLNLKKAGKVVGVKSIEMLKQKDLFALTGYVHGGCSPIGMKKQFVTVFEESAILYDEIVFSGGKKGFQVKTNAESLAEKFNFKFDDIIN